eukprot:10217778-Alexandrium_andersonii.AAC.1
MSASLVGSEMCIRDRLSRRCFKQCHPAARNLKGRPEIMSRVGPSRAPSAKLSLPEAGRIGSPPLHGG